MSLLQKLGARNINALSTVVIPKALAKKPIVPVRKSTMKALTWK
jgi:hypothetical protein